MKLQDIKDLASNKEFKQHIKKGISSTFQKKWDDQFDWSMGDNIKSAEERKKLDQARKDAGGQDKKGDFLRGVSDGMSNDDDMNSVSDYYKDIVTKKEENKSLIVNDTTINKISKSIYNKSIDELREIYKNLLNMYNNIDNLLKPAKTNEAFEEFKKVNKSLTDDDIIKLLDIIKIKVYANTSKNRSAVVENDTKLPNNKITKYWKKIHSPTDKLNLIKMMQYFKLSDNQIINSFDSIGKSLSYKELLKYDINSDQSYKNLSNMDLKKFAYSLGKNRLKEFLLKLKTHIQK